MIFESSRPSTADKISLCKPKTRLLSLSNVLLGALVLIDSIVRLIPGVLGDNECYLNESHYNGVLEYPQYTRPRVWNNLRVPEILLSGNHKKIGEWKKEKSIETTKKKRPDMLK